MTSRFKVFAGKAKKNSPNPLVSIQVRGVLTLNKAALDQLGEPEYVHLLYSDAGEVAIQATTADSPLAYQLRQNGKNDTGTRVISAKAFFDAVGVDYSKTRPVKMTIEEDGLGVLDVSQD